ncbi:MAG: hypothetical protein K2Z81_02965 [Cyanobacteria bacterium]|nr:hypothetical protein [Cyanobacteriota bacterium]
MAKLCNACQDRKPDTSVRGTCQAPSQGQPLPDDHKPWTDSPNFSLCDPCADHFKRCAWCRAPLHNTYRLVPTDKQFCVQFAENNGNHVDGMYVGEQVLVRLVVDSYSRTAWRPKYLSYGVRLSYARFVFDGGQFGWLELYFDLNEADPKAEIQLIEAPAYSWWQPVTTPNEWAITVEVKH